MHTATPQEVTPQWLRFPEAERYSGLGRSTLTRLIDAGEIKAAKVGKSVRINRTSIDEYTVKDHLSNIFGKVGVRGRRALVKQLYLNTIFP